MSDVHKEYIRDGEIFYLTNPDSIVFLSDNYSVLIKMWIYNATNVKNVKIIWNNNSDSLTVPVSFSTGKDSADISVTGLEEKNYNFTVYMEDNLGNRSIPLNGTCSPIGDIWISTMTDRSINRVSVYPTQNIIYWDASPENVYCSEIEYETKTGTTKLLKIMPTETVTYLTDAKPCVRIKYRSLYEIASGHIVSNWKLFNPRIRTLQIVGDVTGWGYGSGTYACDYDDDNPYVFVFPRVHLTGTIWKFDWDNMWDWTIGPVPVRSEMKDAPIVFWWYGDPERGDYDPFWEVPSTAVGDYRIVVNLNTMWITFQKLD
jgi:hypothetical protein